MERHTNRRFDAVMGMEIGGGNGVRPLMVAAHLGVPVIDSDTMGRAYPEAQMTSVAVGGLRPCPLTVVDVRGFESIVDTVPSWKWAERIARKICVEYGSTAPTCQPPRTGAEVKEWGIHGTTTKAIAIGHAVREAQRTHDDPVAAILSVEPGRLLYKGKVVDVERRATEGFLRGRTRFDGMDEWRGAAMEINFQNEWIVAWLDGKPIAMSPDLICVLDSVSGEAVGTETIRYGLIGKEDLKLEPRTGRFETILPDGRAVVLSATWAGQGAPWFALPSFFLLWAGLGRDPTSSP
jgi:DUF917 family protein